MPAKKTKKVDDNYTNILKDFSNQYFDREIQHAHDLFHDDAWPKSADPHYVKKATFLINARKAHLMLLKTMAQHISGVVNATGSNDEGSKQEADKLLQQAMQRMTQPKTDEKK